MNNKKLVGVVAVLVIIALVIGGIYYYRSQEDRDLTLYGNVDIRTVNLGFRVSGRLASLAVDEGDTVTPGALLGKLDDAPFINSLNEAKLTWPPRRLSSICCWRDTVRKKSLKLVQRWHNNRRRSATPTAT